MFDVDRTFLSGIFGLSERWSEGVSSLGFIVSHRFQKEVFNNLRWTDQITGELITQSKDKTGETDTYCNNTTDKLTKTIR